MIEESLPIELPRTEPRVRKGEAPRVGRPVEKTPWRSIPIELLYHEKKASPLPRISPVGKVAIHSGKLGDIVYALPTCREMGITHLVLNVYLPSDEPLRHFSLAAAKQILPLLLAQEYLEEVSITQCKVPLEDLGHGIAGIDYNLDCFRRVARHRAGKKIYDVSPKFCRFPVDDPPAHLGELFGATLGISPDLHDPWMQVPPALETKNSVVISLTHNWRSYPESYWKHLLTGLPRVVFVGHRAEWEQSAIAQSEFIETSDHFRLASLISGARLFLGTISFPYALAEALKVPRGIEICHRHMNAFPLGKNGFVLPADVLQARRQIADRLELGDDDNYRSITRFMKFKPLLSLQRMSNCLSTATQVTDRTRTRTLLDFLRHLRSYFRVLCNF